MPKGDVALTADGTGPAAMGADAQVAMPAVIVPGGVEGEWHGNRSVLIEPVDATRAWYHSSAGRAIIGRRHAVSTSHAAISAGREMPA